MSIYYVLGFIVGISIAFLFVLVLFRITTGKWTLRGEYDERQKIAQGKAYCYSFWTMVFPSLLLVILANNIEVPYMKECVMTILFVGLAVYVVSNILLDAYIPLHQKPTRWIIIVTVIGLMNFAIGIRSILGGEVRSSLINLYCGALMLIGALALLLKEHLRNKEENA